MRHTPGDHHETSGGWFSRFYALPTECGALLPRGHRQDHLASVAWGLVVGNCLGGDVNDLLAQLLIVCNAQHFVVATPYNIDGYTKLVDY